MLVSATIPASPAVPIPFSRQLAPLRKSHHNTTTELKNAGPRNPRRSSGKLEPSVQLGMNRTTTDRARSMAAGHHRRLLEGRGKAASPRSLKTEVLESAFICYILRRLHLAQTVVNGSEASPNCSGCRSNLSRTERNNRHICRLGSLR